MNLKEAIDFLYPDLTMQVEQWADDIGEDKDNVYQDFYDAWKTIVDDIRRNPAETADVLQKLADRFQP